MNDSSIYKTLKYLKKGGVVTSTELLKHWYFHKDGLSALNSRLSELLKMGFLRGEMKNNVIYVKITDSGLNFLKDFSYVKLLKTRERVITFLLGLASGYILTYVFPWFRSLLP